MIETERNKRKTDRAWNTLYQRLDEEGLLSGRPASPFRSPAWKRGVAAAAVALLCLLVSVTYLNRSGQDTDPNLLTRQNSETATTLVTTLEDGSVVYLAGNTSLKFPEHFSSDRREVSFPKNHFCKINRAFVVNFNYISAYSSDSICLNNGEILPLSRNYCKSFKEEYLSYANPCVL